jgi:hypothetical protein
MTEWDGLFLSQEEKDKVIAFYKKDNAIKKKTIKTVDELEDSSFKELQWMSPEDMISWIAK